MTVHQWIKAKRNLIEDYLEAKIALGEITKEEAQKKYKEAVERLRNMSDSEHKSEILDSL